MQVLKFSLSLSHFLISLHSVYFIIVDSAVLSHLSFSSCEDYNEIKSIDTVGARHFRDYDLRKVHHVTPSVTHRRNIAVIKTFGGYPAACMGFYPTVNSRFAKTDGETLRAACILFADLTNSLFLSSFFPSACMRTHAFQILPRRFLVVETPLASLKELRVSFFFPSP